MPVLRCYATVDETWIHYCTPEMKEQSEQWTSSDKCALTKLVQLAGKIMVSVFWDSKGIILIHYLEKGKMITRQYYADFLDHFNGKLKEK